jgi:hypothetical protein
MEGRVLGKASGAQRKNMARPSRQPGEIDVAGGKIGVASPAYPASLIDN